MTDLEELRESSGGGMDFRRVFDEHASYVWSSLRRLGIRDEDRDDLTQEVMMTVHALWQDYDSARPLRPWLFGITYRVALRDRRKRARGREVFEAVDAPDSAQTADVAMESKEAWTLVARAISTIEIHRRAVFIMKEIDGHAAPEIAEALGLPLNTVYSRLRLARDEFATSVARLKREGEVPRGEGRGG